MVKVFHLTGFTYCYVEVYAGKQDKTTSTTSESNWKVKTQLSL